MVSSVRTYVIIFALISCATILYGRNNRELFLEACALYQAGSFDAALQKYQSVTPRSGSVWLNMGNCYYHLNNTVEAWYCWRRAQHNAAAPLYLQAEQYLRTIQPIEKQTFIERLHYQLLLLSVRTGLLLWQLLFVITLFLFLLMLTQTPFRFYRVGMLFCVLGWLLSGAVLLVTYKKQTNALALTREKVTLALGPGTEFGNREQEINAYTEVVVEKTKNGWGKIRKKAFVGWVPVATLRVLDNTDT